MPKLIFHTEVSIEIKAAYASYENQAKGLGEDFLTELEHSFGYITQQPDTWPPFGESTRRFLLNKFPYSVIYSASENTIQVLAVMHNRKKPGYWESKDD